MTRNTSQGARISITRVEGHQGGIWAYLQREVYVQRRGWVPQGPETRARIQPEMLLVDEVADIVYDEQQRQEKEHDRKLHHEHALDQLQLELELERLEP